MAKSLRSKSKRSFRAKKRESGKYAAAEAARIDRLHAKLAAVKDKVHALPDDAAEQEMIAEDQQGAVSDMVECKAGLGEGMTVDESEERSTSILTHGPRGSRREQWRESKGMVAVPKRHRMNRQGGLAARRKAGRPSRRR